MISLRLRSLHFVLAFCMVPLINAQIAARGQSSVPRLVRFSGTIADSRGRVTPGVVGMTFAIYKEREGGAPLWLETQSVNVDAKGHYSVQLGSMKPEGLPSELFDSGDSRWLEARISRQEEQPRVLLLSVPYALKAADSETLGGFPASAFVLAAPLSAGGPASSTGSSGEGVVPPPIGITGSGTTNYLPLWTGSSSLGNSIIYQTGAGSTAKVGINVSAPTATLDVRGPVQVRGSLTSGALGNATAAGGKNSQSQNFVASVFNSNTATAVNQKFRWQAEAVGNNTGNASGSLNLLFAQGLADPVETGLRIGSNGQIGFAPGQTYPGAGTIAGVTAGTGLAGGGNSGNITINIDVNKIPQLAAANTFTQSQTVNGNLTAMGVVSSSAYQIGSQLFAFGSPTVDNAFLGFAGNTSTNGNMDLGVGSNALRRLTSGGSNTGVGAYSLNFTTTGYRNAALGTDSAYNNTIGYSNTAIGYQALETNVDATNNTAIGDSALANLTGTGHNTAVGSGAMLASLDGGANTAVGFEAGYSFHGRYNTYLGYEAGFDLDANLQNATAIGAFSEVEASNAMILGGLGGNAVTVGIGTSAPYSDYALDVETIHSNGIINGGVVVNASGGNLYLGMTNTVHKFRVDTNGGVYADGGFQASGADFAESVAVRGTGSEYEPGDVLEIDQRTNRHLALSHRPYATLVAGIYSTKPGVLASPHHIDEARGNTPEVPLAVMGIVPCKVTTENGPIARGDLLVTSSRAGYAMKGTDRRRMLGAVVGKALEPLSRGSGVIEVLVTLQ